MQKRFFVFFLCLSALIYSLTQENWFYKSANNTKKISKEFEQYELASTSENLSSSYSIKSKNTENPEKTLGNKNLKIEPADLNLDHSEIENYYDLKRQEALYILNSSETPLQEQRNHYLCKYGHALDCIFSFFETKNWEDFCSRL